MQAYISVSYSKRYLLNEEIRVITETLQEMNIGSFVFVDKYKFDATQERAMMLQAFSDIDKSNILIAETSDKGIGIGVEVGYAKAKGKPVIYLRQAGAEHSTTVSGASDFQVVYTGITNLQQQLRNVLRILPGLEGLS